TRSKIGECSELHDAQSWQTLNLSQRRLNLNKITAQSGIFFSGNHLQARSGAVAVGWRFFHSLCGFFIGMV
ncbi:MAG: hypothetical protein BECKG1743E_GA0114224_105751, partial [Candidatus Kentron sp. G]